MSGGGPEVLVVAGEVSGDQHAAALVRAARARRPDLRFFGIGGDRLRAEGMEILHDARDMAVMGIAEVLARAGFFRRVFADTVRVAAARRPAAALLVDYPGFNVRLAVRLRALGIRTVYYICPKVWAWKASRIPVLARSVDRLLTIFPFESACFEGTGLRVEFVGHPLIDVATRTLAHPAPELPWAGEPRVALLPGSRRMEIDRLMPVLWGAAERIAAHYPGAGFIIPSPDAHVAGLVEAARRALPAGAVRCAVVTGQTHDVLRTARAAIVASGTATLDAALMDCPMAITYRVAPLTYWFGRAVVRIPWVGLVNIVARRTVCPELLQRAATPQRLAEAVLPLLEDGPARQTLLDGLRAVRQALGAPGAAERAAAALLDELG